jgi:Tol biopolymer transport system component
MPRWSPDGYWIAYTRLGGIDILSADTGEEAVLLEDVSASAPPVWSADSESLFFAASLGELSGIWTIPRTGGEPRSVAVDGDRAVANFWFDTDGERLFFTRLESREADIWVVDLEGRP